jgi:hypothetical protein
MNVRSLEATRGRPSAVGIAVLAAAFLVADGLKSARAQHGNTASPLPAQRAGPPGSLNPYATTHLPGRYWSYPVSDPTAAERAVLAGRVYRTVLDESVRRAMTPPRPGGGPRDAAALFRLELAERLGQWSLRWQEAQDNAAKSRAARYQALSDHLSRMSALEGGRFHREAVKAAGGPGEPKPPRAFAEIARFFRPVTERGIDRIVPALLESERPVEPVGVAVTSAEQVELAGRVYRAILDEAVDRFLASPREDGTRRPEGAIFDALLAERLGFWSDLWRQAEDAAVTDRASRSAGARDRAARIALAGARLARPDGRTATLRSHIERMGALESGRFVNEALERAGRTAVAPVDMTPFRAFADLARFLRIEAESQLLKASRPQDADITASSQAEAAGRIYQAILDEAARRYLEAPRAGREPTDDRLVFDPLLAERLAAWSIFWGRAQVGSGGSRVERFAAIREHIERMASLEDGRSLHDTFEREGPLIGGPAAPAPPREFAEVARFFRLEALWELELIKSR